MIVTVARSSTSWFPKRTTSSLALAMEFRTGSDILPDTTLSACDQAREEFSPPEPPAADQSRMSGFVESRLASQRMKTLIVFLDSTLLLIRLAILSVFVLPLDFTLCLLPLCNLRLRICINIAKSLRNVCVVC